jgi:hypothetical protein
VIRCRALDAEGVDPAELRRPGLELPVARRCGGHRGDAKTPAELIQGDGDVDVAVGVDATVTIPPTGATVDCVIFCSSGPRLCRVG